MNKKELIKDIKTEIRNCKKYFTDKEKGRLSVENFNPASTYRCIYGQATLNCYNSRAIELCRLCSVGNSVRSLEVLEFPRISKFKPRTDPNTYTKLEAYIYLEASKETAKKILLYIKGDRVRMPKITL